MESSVFARAAQRAGAGAAPAEAVQLDWVLTPFRAQRFYDLYYPAISRPLAYGASGYLFYRSEDDSDHFVHMSFWSDRADFDRWCREVVWWGNKKGAYLYQNRSGNSPLPSDRQLAGHPSREWLRRVRRRRWNRRPG